MLAMVVNDNAGRLNARVVWAAIASELAPTGAAFSELMQHQIRSPGLTPDLQ